MPGIPELEGFRSTGGNVGARTMTAREPGLVPGGSWWLSVLIVACLGLPAAHLAHDASSSGQSNEFTNSTGTAQELELAANKVRRDTGGRVLSVSPSVKGGKRGYSVRVLLEGKRVKQIFVAAEGLTE